jgi:hypothetical protein
MKPNIYLKNLDVLIKFDIRYSHLLIMIDGRYETAVKVLGDVIKLIDRCIYINPSQKFLALFLHGVANKNIFKTKIHEFQSNYLEKAKKEHKYRHFDKHVPY